MKERIKGCFELEREHYPLKFKFGHKEYILRLTSKKKLVLNKLEAESDERQNDKKTQADLHE